MTRLFYILIHLVAWTGRSFLRETGTPPHGQDNGPCRYFIKGYAKFLTVSLIQDIAFFIGHILPYPYDILYGCVSIIHDHAGSMMHLSG